jgi:hypothetical protein
MRKRTRPAHSRESVRCIGLVRPLESLLHVASSCVRRAVLTGTPVHNNLHELWALLHWLHAPMFTPTTERAFRESFDLTRGTYNVPFLAAAKALLGKLMLRRIKANVTLDVPPRQETTVFIPLSEAQRFWTYRLLTRMDGADLAGVFDDASTYVATHGEPEASASARPSVGASLGDGQDDAISAGPSRSASFTALASSFASAASISNRSVGAGSLDEGRAEVRANMRRQVTTTGAANRKMRLLFPRAPLKSE